jgi:hypothetical protein
MTVDLASTLTSFVGTNTLTTKLVLDAAAHLVESLKDSGLTDLKKNQLVFTTLLAHLAQAETKGCLPLLSKLPFLSFLNNLSLPKNLSCTKATDAVAPVVSADAAPLSVREPEAKKV